MWWRIKTTLTLTRILVSDARVGLMEAEGTNMKASVDTSHLRCDFGVLIYRLRVCVQVL